MLQAELAQGRDLAEDGVGLFCSIQWCATQGQLLQLQLPKAFGEQMGEQLVQFLNMEYSSTCQVQV